MAREAERSLQLTKQGIKEAETALEKLAMTKSALAAHISALRGKAKGASPKTTVGISRTTINNFFKGEPVQYPQFKEICKALGLDWKEVAGRSGHALAYAIDCIFKDFQFAPELKDELRQLKYNLPELPDPEQEEEKFQEVWAERCPIWTEQLRAVMIKYRNIGHDWQFSEEQIELLMQYHVANEFLLECMDSNCYVSREVRQEIEETLLLPMEEIERRKRVKDEG